MQRVKIVKEHSIYNAKVRNAAQDRGPIETEHRTADFNSTGCKFQNGFKCLRIALLLKRVDINCSSFFFDPLPMGFAPRERCTLEALLVI